MKSDFLISYFKKSNLKVINSDQQMLFIVLMTKILKLQLLTTFMLRSKNKRLPIIRETYSIFSFSKGLISGLKLLFKLSNYI